MNTPNTPYLLIVDDDPRNRRVLEAMLAGEGYRVVSVGSGRESLAAVGAEPPAVILLDLMMPEMDGFEVVRRLRADAATQTIPIVAVTAIDDAGSRARLAAAGVVDVLGKPVERWTLRTCLGRLLEKR
ncbi:response regulator [Aromatoleum toluclasticum]|uniref:response regulator n=1 Tax=Aromatoleum toluclasticum TaxID=92003 RepID=UPI00037C66B3|nr:response regulator [Aromatoleum toluclasticum]